MVFHDLHVDKSSTMDLKELLVALDEVEKKYAAQDAKREKIRMHRVKLLEMGRQGVCRVTRSMAREMMDELCDLVAVLSVK